MTLMARLVLLVLLLVLAVACGGRWRPNTPVSLPLRDQSDAYERVVTTVRELGYPIEEEDPKHGYLRITAKTTASTPTSHGWEPAPGSWFTVQVSSTDVVIQAYGYLVRDNETVRKNDLDDEMQALTSKLRTRLGVRGGAVARQE